jgi:hypothetical protein
MKLNIAKLILMRLALAVLLVLVPFKSSQAIEQVPQAMERPVPPEWRAPFARFLQELGATNVEVMLNGTKVGYLFNIGLSSTVFGITGPELMALRVETAETCSKDYDLCLTIIAQMANGEVVAQAMFPAGNRVNSADVITNFFGTRSFPVRFYSKETITTVTQTAKGVFVQSGRQPAPPL